MAQVSARAWSELLHAEVAYLLRQAGVPVLHIKGPTVALWLYDDQEDRPWGDVDVLVPPSRMDDALGTLLAADFVERHPGVNRRTTTDHAITLGQVDPGTGGLVSEIDVHDRFEGVEGDPERAFQEFWRRREPDQLAHVDVWFPDLPTRALLIALNTARSATSKARRDLTLLVGSANPEDWEDVIALAKRVDALPALRAGLELDPHGEAVVATTELAAVEVSAEWSLRRDGAPRTALRLAALAGLPWRRRPAAVARWLFPAPAVVRMRDPKAIGGGWRLLGGYIRRLRDGVASALPSLRALARLRASHNTPRGGTAVEDFEP